MLAIAGTYTIQAGTGIDASCARGGMEERRYPVKRAVQGGERRQCEHEGTGKLECTVYVRECAAVNDDPKLEIL